MLSASACSAPADNKVKISFVQTGQETIIKEYSIGDTLKDVFSPVQPQDDTLIVEWNVTDDYVVSKDDTITTTTYTKGLEFSSYFKEFRSYQVESYTGSAKKVIVPEYYKGLRVTKLLGKRSGTYGVFDSNQTIEEVILPEGLLQINQYAFYKAKNLKKVNLPSTLVKVENHVFADCKFYEQTFTIPNAEYGERAFFGCNTETLIISDGVKQIPSFCFAGATGKLKNVVIPLSLTNISGTAFWMQPIENFYYCGDEGDFYNVSITEESHSGDNFENYLYNGANRYKIKGGQSITEFTIPVIYYYSETQPQTDGNFWRYVNGVPTAW